MKIDCVWAPKKKTRKILHPAQIQNLKNSLSADYLTKVAVRNKASKDIKVEEIMTERSKLMTVDPHHTTVDAMTLMIKHNFRHVPVVNLPDLCFASPLCCSPILIKCCILCYNQSHLYSAHTSHRISPDLNGFCVRLSSIKMYGIYLSLPYWQLKIYKT